MYMNVPSSFIRNSQKLERAQVSLTNRMGNTPWYVNPVE